MTHDAPIADIDLTRRLTLALERRGIATVGALCAMTGRDLARINGIGQACLAEVARALADHGLALAGEHYEPPPVRRVNLTLTAEVAEHAAKAGNASAALEDAYRAQHGLGPRPALDRGGRPQGR